MILSPTSRFNNGKTKKKEFHFDIVTTMSEHHFRVCFVCGVCVSKHECVFYVTVHVFV